MSFKKIISLSPEDTKKFEAWDQVRFYYSASCYCTSIMTDMESFIEVEAMEEECLNSLCKDFSTLGFNEETEVAVEIDLLKKRERRIGIRN